jgi:acid phosphatase (class A)
MIERYKTILINVDSIVNKQFIDDIKYQDILIEYPVPDIIQLDWKTLLDPPPSNSSNYTRKELEYLSRLTTKRTQAQEALVYNIDAYPEYYLLEVIKQYQLNDHNNIIREFYKIIRPIIWNTKYLFNRPRPHQLSEIYHIPIEIIQSTTHHTPSYPSGHTVYSALYGKILSYYYPEYKRLFDAAVEKTMLGRELQGVHYPSDNKSSLILVNQLFDHLHEKVLYDRQI